MSPQADASAVAWRKWFNGRGGGGHTKAAGQTPLVPTDNLTRHDILDRHQQHVAACPSCQNGLRLFKRTQNVLKGASALGFLALAGVLGRGDWDSVSLGTVGTLVGIGGMLWVSQALHRLESKFGFADYVHAQRN